MIIEASFSKCTLRAYCPRFKGEKSSNSNRHSYLDILPGATFSVHIERRLSAAGLMVGRVKPARAVSFASKKVFLMALNALQSTAVSVDESITLRRLP